MDFSKECRIPASGIATLSGYGLLQYTRNGSFLESRELGDIFPVSLELNEGVFTKRKAAVHFPTVSVCQTGNSIVTSCACGGSEAGLCEHQAEVLYAIMERKQLRVFFDKPLRHKTLLNTAKEYGLEEEPDLDEYFRISIKGDDIHPEPLVKELLQINDKRFRDELLPLRATTPKPPETADTEKRTILVIDKHRLYNQPAFQLMQADTTLTGKLKNPIDKIDPLQRIWESQDPAVIKFLTAISAFSQKEIEFEQPADNNALRLIFENPMQLSVYHHDRSVSESVSARSLKPVHLQILQAEISLSVFKKFPFFEITGKLLMNDSAIPFDKLVLRHQCFIFYRQTYYLVNNPDMLRVIRFFKKHNEILLVHASKYEAFLQTVLRSLEDLIQIDYSYIQQASPAQLAERKYTTERLIYLQQRDNYIYITPVMKYGGVEVPVYSRKQLTDTDRNGNEFKIRRNNEAEVALTTIVMHQHPDFNDQIREYEYFYLHKNKFLDEDWFLDAFETWRKEGITILGFNELPGNRRNPHKARIQIEVNSGIDWFNAHLKVSFGNKPVSLKQLHKAIRNKSRFVELGDGTCGLLPDEWIRSLEKYFQAGEIDAGMLKFPKINFSEISAMFDKEVLSQETQVEIAQLGQAFTPVKEIPETPVPAGLQAELRAYQREGLNWLNYLDGFNFGGCLADDMGLGKTVQIIAFILSQKEKHGHATHLVVAPTSLLFNWQEELRRFAPSLSVQLQYGANRLKSAENASEFDVVLTSYGTLISDIGFLKTFRFGYVFLDESQAIKNPNSERYKAARLLQSRNRIVLTGTPVENNTVDLYGQLSFACPGLLGSKQYFREIYSIPIDRFGFSKRAMELQEKVKPFILRRTKKQVARELPEKTEMTIYCEMNAEQRKIYDAYEQELRDYIASKTDDEIHRNSMHVLTGLTRLRQICNSPVLLKEGHSGENSVKIEVLTEQIENKSREHKILVFSQFTSMLDLIRTELETRKIPFEYLTGQTKDRGAKVTNFQTNDAVRVFLISLKAGGVGLNLTEADYVYLVDPWWNPAAENQAIDRSHRIGQHRNVVAVRLICSGTIEEKIRILQQRKSQLALDLVKTDGTMLQQMSKSDLLEML
ncbi:DEAD/DEAH box helicase [Chitinophaga rhizosphaerae]|uniref:DEAD/DEAH box helicase n=1 Tax=Chitinophaga rhizosphaerae TaxID=1864947 RepID=UPI000F801D3B|nr:DEAD/DEAH box helicase [Chitinophaga rhizosphaerae]